MLTKNEGVQELTIFNHDGVLVVDSREVARWIEMRHSDLLEKVGGYNTALTNGKFRPLDFFISSTYVDPKGEVLPCYLLTCKGCDMENSGKLKIQLTDFFIPSTY